MTRGGAKHILINPMPAGMKATQFAELQWSETNFIPRLAPSYHLSPDFQPWQAIMLRALSTTKLKINQPNVSSSALEEFNKLSREVYLVPRKKQLSLFPSVILLGNSIGEPSK